MTEQSSKWSMREAIPEQSTRLLRLPVEAQSAFAGFRLTDSGSGSNEQLRGCWSWKNSSGGKMAGPNRVKDGIATIAFPESSHAAR